ncbi:MAG: carotenoid biosynthesis protein [Chitinophagaceae bacterium]
MTPAGLQSFKIPINPIFIAALFHVSGAIGIIFGNSALFISLTPLNLLIMFFLVIWTTPEWNMKSLFFFTLCYATGFLSEMIGVNTGMLFGSYRYGNILGPKISGVPLLIAINWFMVVYGSGHFISIMEKKIRVKLNLFSKIFIGASVCTIFDWIMEPAAIRLGFWKWSNPGIPVSNYITWFLLSALLIFVFEKCNFKKHSFTMYLLLIQTLFFLILR